MVQVRYNIFETNSSSSHSLVIMTNEEWNKVKKGELFIDVFAAEKGKTKLVTEDILIKEAAKDWDKFERRFDPENRTFEQLLEEYKNSSIPQVKKALKTHNLNLFSFAGERFINTKSSVWEKHKIKHIDKDHVQVDIDHYFG